jgi:hypothetical protein
MRCPLSPPRVQHPAALLPLLAALAALASSGCGGSGSGGGGSSATSIDPPAGPEAPGDQPAFPFAEHLDQEEVTAGRVRFSELFVIGDELFETQFGALDGAGALALPDGSALPSRFSRVPPGGGRFTGPNGQACSGCHNSPFGTSAGEAAANVAQDPAGLGLPPFNLRNTISLFGSGLIQRLAEEMTAELLAARDEAAALALQGGAPVTRDLAAKGVAFGAVTAIPGAGGVSFDTSAVEGVAEDLVIRPFGWKGDTPALRTFCRGAARNELGMEADELVLKDPLGRADPDGDGVEGELSVGDVTAITVYVAAQETPTTVERLVSAGLMTPPSPEFAAQSRRGEELFQSLGCAACHVPELHLANPVFEEPTLRGGGLYHDADLDPGATGLDPAAPFTFHLAREGDFPRPEPAAAGGLRVRLLGDLKRHVMGRELADFQDSPVRNADDSRLVLAGAPVTVPRAVFLTAELWGVGSTGPWLHDGRAATLEEAILLHGEDAPPAVGDPARSEAQEARDAFAALAGADREAVVTFLKSLVLFELPEE